MTDITELTQREKFEAWVEEADALPWGILKKHRNQDGSYPGPHYTYMWKAWQAASAELVEALEKVQAENTAGVAGMAESYETTISMLRSRIAELENDEVRQRLANAEHQLYMAELAKHNLKASRKAQFRKRRAAEKRIAELETYSKTVLEFREAARDESQTMTIKLTREFMQNIISGHGFGVAPSAVKAMAEYIVAAMDSEPVGEFYEDGPLNWYQISDGDRVPAHRRIPLYRHAQQPVVLDEMTADGIIDMHECGYVEGWNACRAAMLNGGNDE